MNPTNTVDTFIIYSTISITFFYGLFKTIAFIKIRKFSKEKGSLLGKFKTPHPALYAISMLLLILTSVFSFIALHQTRENEAELSKERNSVDILFLVDVSLSMNAIDVYPSRLKRAQDLMIRLTSELSGNRVGIVVFAGNSFAFCPMTADLSAFRDYVNALGVDMVGKKGTDLDSAFSKAEKILTSTKLLRNRIVVFISDGEDHESSKLKKLDADLMVWGIGTKEGGPIYFGEETSGTSGYVSESGKLNSNIKSTDLIISKLHDENLAAFADFNHGTYTNVSFESYGAFKLLDKIDSMKKNQSILLQKIRQEDGADFYLLLALICFFSERVFRFFYFQKKSVILTILVWIACLNPRESLFAWELDPGGSRVKKGVELYNEKKFTESENKFKEAEIYFENDPRLKFNQGSNSYELKAYEESIRKNDEIISDPNVSLDIKLKAYYNIGNSYFKMKNFKSAQKSYKEALNIRPNHLPSKKNLEMLNKKNNKGSESKNEPEGDKKLNQKPRQNGQEKNENQESSGNQLSKENADRMMDHFSPDSILRNKPKGRGSTDNEKFW